MLLSSQTQKFLPLAPGTVLWMTTVYPGLPSKS